MSPRPPAPWPRAESPRARRASVRARPAAPSRSRRVQARSSRACAAVRASAAASFAVELELVRGRAGPARERLRLGELDPKGFSQAGGRLPSKLDSLAGAAEPIQRPGHALPTTGYVRKLRLEPPPLGCKRSEALLGSSRRATFERREPLLRRTRSLGADPARGDSRSSRRRRLGSRQLGGAQPVVDRPRSTRPLPPPSPRGAAGAGRRPPPAGAPGARSPTAAGTWP